VVLEEKAAGRGSEIGMDNASLIYEDIESYTDIQKLIGQTEDMFIDFKEAEDSNTGKMRDDDKTHYSKAASGFAHQEGGVLVWGIKARKDKNDVNCAIELKPINNVKAFLSDLYDYVKYSTEPVVDGIQHKAIYENDDEDGNKGFAVCLFPKSDREHKALGRTTSDFYKRQGDSFVPLGTNDIRLLFSRVVAPDLDLHVASGYGPSRYCSLSFSLENRGKGIAKNCSVYLGLTSQDKSMRTSWSLGRLQNQLVSGDDELSEVVQLLEVRRSPKYKEHVKFDPGVVICPAEEVHIGTLWCTWMNQVSDIEVAYKIIAEDMIPKEGNTRIKSARH